MRLATAKSNELLINNYKKTGREIMINKLVLLRERIEAWCADNPYNKMDNRFETRNDDGEIVWFQSDWEYVDDFHNGLINKDDWHYNVKTLRKLNQMWRRYKQ